MKEKIYKWFRVILSTTDDPEDPYLLEDDCDSDDRYLSREMAINIADKECNLRKSIYREMKLKGYKCGLVEIDDYYATLVKYKNRYAWYIKVIKGKCGFKFEDEYYVDEIDRDVRAACIVFADTGEYEYLGYDFDTRNIRMVTDNEFISYITYVKH